MDGSHASRIPLRYVACVSYPRSGHHLTVRLLSDYFEREFSYCSFYDGVAGVCCRQFPCACPTMSMTKNHDMDVVRRGDPGVAKIDGIPYLVLVRNFLDAAVSDFQLYLRSNEDSYEAWLAFAKRKIGYYRAFVQKWTMVADDIDKLVVRYEDLTSQPIEAMCQIVRYFAPLRQVDLSRLRRIIKNADLEDVRPTQVAIVPRFGVRNRRRIEEFQHFNADAFAALETELSAELAANEYSLRFAPTAAKSAA